MIGLAALIAGLLVAAGVYSLTSRNVQRMAIGFLLLSNGVNLLVITASGLPAGAAPPFAGAAQSSDPLPQAFVLTAIVIGLGAVALLVAMGVRVHRETGRDEVGDELPEGAAAADRPLRESLRDDAGDEA